MNESVDVVRNRAATGEATMDERRAKDDGAVTDAGAARSAAGGEAGPAVRYERGGRIYASDGCVGTLRQLVVDEAAGQVTALVVALEGGKRTVRVPPELVARSVGSAIFLQHEIDRERFAAGVTPALAYDRRHYAKANPGKLLRAAASAPADRLRTVTRVDRRGAVTGTGEPLLAPRDVEPTGRTPLRTRFAQWWRRSEAPKPGAVGAD